MRWKGPYTIGDLLDQSVGRDCPKPPLDNGVYVISRKPWKLEPAAPCNPLYVGSNTGRSKRFRTRIGDLIADMFGFYGGGTGHHSGGQSLHEFCRREKLNPTQLYIGWAEDCECARCTENHLFDRFRPRLNRNRPSRCPRHPTR